MGDLTHKRKEKRMKKQFALGLCTIMMTGLLAGCGSAPAESSSSAEATTGEKKTEAAENTGDVLEIEFFQQKGEEGPRKGFQEIIDKFNEANPDIVVTMNTVPDPGTVLTSRISSGDVPVIFTDIPTQAQFRQKVANGIVQDLTGQDFLNNANEASLSMCTLDDGGIYALPYTRSYYGVFYNEQLFEDNNIEVPETWDEFTAVCEKFQEAGITPIGLNGKDPGRCGHLFQDMTATWNIDGFDLIKKACEGEAKIEGDAGFTKEFERMKTVLSYANEDALALSDTECYTNFVNGEYAMCPTGSYARGTIQALNSDFKLGCFVLPNDTRDTTNLTSGLDACICVSAKASEEEKAAAYKFLAFLAEPENAEIFFQNDGAPSCITGVGTDDTAVANVTELISKGQTHDWMASTIDSNVQNDLYNVVQEFWDKKDVEQTLKNMDLSIATTSAQ